MRKFFRPIIALASILALGAACVEMQQPGPTKESVPGDYPAHPVTQSSITATDFAVRVRALADDRFAGRGPGTPKGEAAADWIASEMKRIGLKPGNKGSYFQDVPAASIALDPATSSFEITGKDGTKALKFADEVAFWTPRFNKTEQTVKDSDVVFVGYGVTAPEYQWDDFKGIDVRGKR